MSRITLALLSLLVFVGFPAAELVRMHRPIIRPDSAPLPTVIAHRGAAGALPANTLAALRWAGERGLGAEVDIGLTADGVPVLSHEPWLTPETCGEVANPAEPLARIVRLRSLTLAELQRDYRCGAVADPQYEGSQALPGGEAVPSLAEALATLPPSLPLYLDLKIDEPDSPAEAFLALLPLLDGRAGPVWIEVPSQADARAFRAVGFGGASRTLLLSWPAFTPSEEDPSRRWFLTGALTRLATDLRILGPVLALAHSGADGIVSGPPILSPGSAQRVRDAGGQVVWFVPPDTEAAQRPRVDALCAGPADLLILDYADRLSCAPRP